MLHDVIAALATPPGRSATALIRVSGRGAHEVAASVLTPFRVRPFRSARLAKARHPPDADVLDQVLYLTYGAPASYTGEDLVEISTHGGLLIPGEVLAAFFAAGARQAHAGEFTRRALEQGKLDLLQAEAVADLIDATAPAQRRTALDHLDRGLSRRIAALRDEVLQLEALVCYEIDFPEEDSGPVPNERVEAAIAGVRDGVAALLRTAVEGERLRDGAIAVIAGRPNVGKSSLFNALLGRERAIVTDIPGTTRDAIEAPVTCGGFPFRLVDTAGLRESSDVVERLGVEVSRGYLECADVVLFCVPASEAITAGEADFLATLSAPVVTVRTKADLAIGREAATPADLAVSAITGSGLPEVRAALAAQAFTLLAARQRGVETVVTRERHRTALARSLEEVTAFAEARRAGLEGAVAATHLRAAVTALEDVIGVVTTDEVLERVFATFCVGK